jgi:L-fuconate dehydratase
MFQDMGKLWEHMVADSQLRWIGPEKGVIHLATAAVNNAAWDLYAKSRCKPLWKLVVDFTPEELVRSTAFRYVTDAVTRDEALEILKAKVSGKAEREAIARKEGYPAYVTSAGWIGELHSKLCTHNTELSAPRGYSDEKVAQLTKEGLQKGFNHFKMKVGLDKASDLRRGRIMRYSASTRAVIMT